MGFLKGEAFPPPLLRNIAEVASGTVLRKTEQAVSLLTPFSISHTKVKFVLDKVGSLQKNYTENRLLDINQVEEPKHKKKFPFCS